MSFSLLVVLVPTRKLNIKHHIQWVSEGGSQLLYYNNASDDSQEFILAKADLVSGDFIGYSKLKYPDDSPQSYLRFWHILDPPRIDGGFFKVYRASAGLILDENNQTIGDLSYDDEYNTNFYSYDDTGDGHWPLDKKPCKIPPNTQTIEIHIAPHDSVILFAQENLEHVIDESV